MLFILGKGKKRLFTFPFARLVKGEMLALSPTLSRRELESPPLSRCRRGAVRLLAVTVFPLKERQKNSTNLKFLAEPREGGGGNVTPSPWLRRAGTHAAAAAALRRRL